MDFRSYFDSKHPNFKIMIGSLLLLFLIGATYGIMNAVWATIWYAIIFSIFGTATTILDGFISKFFGRANGYLLYRRQSTLVLTVAVIVAFVYLFSKATWVTAIAELLLTSVSITAFYIGSLWGTKLWSNRDAVRQAAEDLRTGKASPYDVAGAAFGAVRESVEKGIGDVREHGESGIKRFS